jgi:sugar transferase (PEP-CTERM/EpsH1 system associated)
MKILFLAHRTPYPPDKGDKIRSYNILRQLTQRHSVSMAYWVDDPKDIKHTTVLSGLCTGKVVPVQQNSLAAKARALSSLLRGASFSEGYYHSPLFRSTVERMINEDRPDLIYVFSSAMAPYVYGHQDIPRIIDFVDVDSDKWGQLAHFANFPLSLLYRIEQKRLACLEINASSHASFSLFVSPVESDLFRKIGGQGTILCVPNGVDCEVGRIPLRVERKPNDRGSGREPTARPIKLLFVGMMNYYPNSDAVLYFAREILPLIRTRFPQVHFDIVGRFPTRSVRRLHGRDGIRVVGEVDDVYDNLIQSNVSVAPMRITRGVQNKVLEAMAVGVPVVATSEAVKGINVGHEREVLVGDTPEIFAAQVIRLLSESPLRTRVIKNAWQRMRQDYNWNNIGAQLEELIQNVASNTGGGVVCSHPC